MFQPPRCPNDHCPRHSNPTPGFYVRKGFYHPLCRTHPVPRFRCRTCLRGFSRQTFRADYRDHRPDLNQRVFISLATSTGLRQTARNVGLSRRCTELKFRKLAVHLAHLNLNLRGDLPAGSSMHFDELETYEGRRNTRPLSLPILIETDSRLIIWGESAPIRPHGRMSEARKRAVAEDERRYGKRQDLSRASVQRTLQRGADLAGKLETVILYTDEKSTYPGLAREAFGEERLDHRRTNSKLPRTTWNPLFPINHTDAMARDHMSRLRRESWLVSKQGCYLDLAFQMWMAYRNYVRRRFNHDKESPAQVLGFVNRRMTPGELLSWRQDWGKQSIHPLAWNLASVGARAARAVA
jgi:hypothetical protein